MIPTLKTSLDIGVVVNDKEIIGAAMRGRYNVNGVIEQQIELNGKEYSNTITTVQKDSLVCEVNNE